MRNCDKITIRSQASLREVMQIIDRGAMEVALVTSEDGRLLGTVTDGDIRRAILQGLSLEAPVHEVMNRRFTAVDAEVSSPGSRPNPVGDISQNSQRRRCL